MLIFKGDIEAARSIMQALIAERKILQTDKNTLSATRDAARDKITDRQNAEKAARAELKFSTAEAIDKQIRELETRQARTTMSLNDEKKIIKDIKALQQSKRSITAVAEMRTQIDQARAQKDEVDKAYNDKSHELKLVNDRITTQRTLLDTFNKDTSNQKDIVPNLRKKQQDLRNAIGENLKTMRNLRNEFKIANDLYFAQLQEEKQRQREVRQKEIDQKKAEKEAYLKQL